MNRDGIHILLLHICALEVDMSFELYLSMTVVVVVVTAVVPVVVSEAIVAKGPLS